MLKSTTYKTENHEIGELHLCSRECLEIALDTEAHHSEAPGYIYHETYV